MNIVIIRVNNTCSLSFRDRNDLSVELDLCFIRIWFRSIYAMAAALDCVTHCNGGFNGGLCSDPRHSSS